MQKQEKINIYQLYSLLFIFMCAIVFVQFILSHRTFVWNVDGRQQHLPAYIYYGKYLRTIFYNIFISHSFNIPQWDFSIGEGSDILQALNYYVIGDPFAFFSFLFPSHLMYIYYCVMGIIRIYCAGLAFIYLCRVMGHSERISILAGTLMYAFCYWSIFTCARHPYFINPMVWFPLIIAEIERIIQGKKPFLYILFVMLAAISSFYFFYMLVILVALYIIFRLLYLYKLNSNKIFKLILSFFIYSCFALGLAAFLFVPICYIFLHDSRTTHYQLTSYLYSLSYYLKLPLIFLFPRNPFWLCMGFPVLSAVSLLILFKDCRKNCFLIFLFVLSIMFMALPICGLALNGFSYVTNRWIWAFVLLCSYTVVVTWKHLLKTVRLLLFLSVALVGYSMSIYIKYRYAFIIYIVFLIFFACTGKIKKDIRSIIALSLICLNIIFNANIWYYTYKRECLTLKNLAPILSNETGLVKQTASEDKDFFRYSGKKLTTNASMNNNLSSVKYDWTLSNSNIVEFRRKMELPPSWSTFNYEDYDSRAILESLACVRYFYKNDKTKMPIPYGFSSSKIKSIYKNKYSLPIAYTYDSFVIRDEWDMLDSVRKSEVLLRAAVLEEPYDDIACCNPSFLSKNIPVSLTKNNSLFSICPEAHDAGELYLCLKNIRTQESLDRRFVVHVKSSGLNDISFIYAEPGHEYYANIHDISINLGYFENNIENIDVIFPQGGTFTVDDIQVISLPMTQFASFVEERKKDAFNNVKIGTNTVEGDISLTEQKLLCFAIPFAEGWKATVDGKPARLLRTNVMHMSVPLEAGEHKVVLTYHTPLLRVGFIVSLFSWVIFLFWAYRSRRK